jgi:6,7-dimethyl-8-ribityllumazine synthase
MSTKAPPEEPLDARGLRFAICAARWNGEITSALLERARAAILARHGEVDVYRCSGAFELAPLVARVARKGRVDGIVAIGALVRGGTDHYSLLASETTRALGALALELATNPRPIAVAFGVLTCETLLQAQERAGRLDKGCEVAVACIEQVRALQAVGD